jgi:hypothetical protein
MTEIAVRQDTAPAIPHAAAGLVEWAHAASAAHTLASSLVKTSFVPAAFKGKPEEAAAAILAGAEVGLSPMSSLRAFDVIQGVASPRAITLRAIVQSQGHEMVVTEESPSRVVIKGRRRDSDEWQTVEWTIQRATQLGLTQKQQWKQQPQTMLVARATSDMARRLAADSILGIGYTSEELRDEEEPTTAVRREPRKVQRTRPATPEPEFDEPEQPAQEPVKATSERGEAGITDSQSKKLHALLRECGITDREAGLAYISQIIERDIESTKELSKAEASKAIDQIETEKEPVAPEPLFDEGGAA